MVTVPPDELQRRLVLEQSEKYLRKQLAELDWPFLGLFGEKLNKDMRAAVFTTISANPSVGGFIRHLELYPALFSIYLCQILLQTFGTADYFQLWPEIQKALRLRDAPGDAEQQQLWMAFRRACVALGLEVSTRYQGTHFRVDEFLRQVGLSVAFADDLAERCMRFARRHGLPDEDDPEGIISWQEALCRTLTSPFSRTARAAVERDRRGFYTQLFLRVAGDGRRGADPDSPLGKAFAKVVAEDGTAARKFGRAAIPRMVMQNEALGVMLPGGRSCEWTVAVDSQRRRYRTSGVEQFVPFDTYLPLKVAVEDETDHQVLAVPLWEDERNNRVLVFSSETGLLRGRGALSEAPVSVSPGAYYLLSRFDTNGSGSDAVQLCEDPAVFVSHIRLSPGEQLKICRGPASLVIAANEEASIQWQGEGIISREGHAVFPDAKLSLRIEVPSELRDAGTPFDLELSASDAGAAQTIALVLNDRGAAEVDVGSVVSKVGWRPGVWRVLAQLKRRGEARTLARSATLCWIGLKQFRSGPRFICSERPANLFEPGCDNVRVTANEVSCRSGDHRSMRLVFALDSRRDMGMSWAVPGVFVDLLEYDEQGLAIRKPLALGGTLLASATSSQQLVISADRPATLRVGNFVRKVNFSARGSVTLPLGTLSDSVNANDSCLVYRLDDSGAEVILARLVRPHEVLEFAVRLEPGRGMIRFATANRIDAVKIHARELLSGTEKTLLADSGATIGNQGRSGPAQCLITSRPDGFSTSVFVDLDCFSAGAWLLRLEVLHKNSWGRLSNSRGDHYAAGLLLAGMGKILTADRIGDLLANLAEGPGTQVLRRFHDALQYCYAQPCWNEIRWLEHGWRILVDRCTKGLPGSLDTLVELAVQPPLETSSPSWIPQVFVLSRKPNLLVLEANEYAGLTAREYLVARVLRVIASLPTALSTVFGPALHVAAASGFSNLPGMQRGESPRGFDTRRFAKAVVQLDDRKATYVLADDSFVPGDEQLLGPIHYRYAKAQFEDRYARSLGGNEIRRGQAIGMARQTVRLFPRLGLADRPLDPVVDPWPTLVEESTPDHICQKLEILREFEHFVSAFAWSCRLEARNKGTLTRFLDHATPLGVETPGPLGFLLYVGEGLLSFYLLLWEIVLRADLDGQPRLGRVPHMA